MREFERILLSRGDDLRLRLSQARAHLPTLPKNGVQAGEYRKLEALYLDLIAVVEAHELQLQSAKAMEPA